MKTIFRKNLEKLINDRLDRSKDAADLQHPGLVGSLRENLLSSLLQELLPEGHYIGTGKICDQDGHLSKQLDVIIFDKRGLPPYLYSEKEGIFPIHGVSYAFEVKSVSSKKNINDALEKAKSVRLLNGPQPHFIYFAFDSDLVSSKSEVDRVLAELNELEPMVDIICVVNKLYSYWHHTTKWNFFDNTENHNEIIGLVIGILNTLYMHKSTGVVFNPGEYLGS